MTEAFRFTAMGCQVVVGGGTDDERLAIQALFAERESVFSRFLPGSELNRVNAAAGVPTRVSRLFGTTLAIALSVAAQTDGLVDPTLGRALEAAGYDRDFALLEPDLRLPGAGEPGAWRSVGCDERLVWLPRGVKLDLNGVVKALAVDDALALLDGPGFVSAGGDLAARGGLDVALPGGGSVRLLRGGLATSGTVERRWLRAGRVQHHLIDPRTGRPSGSPWTQVTVAGATCLAADVAAKAAFLLGERGPAWLEGRGLPGRFLAGESEVVSRSWRGSLKLEVACT